MDAANTLTDLFGVAEQVRENPKGSRRLIAVIWSFLYLVWAHRNKLIFDKERGKLLDLFFEFQVKTFEWITRRDRELRIDWVNWLSDPLSF